MIVATAFVVNQLLTFDKPYERRNKATRGLIALVFLFANIHFWTNNLTLHSAVFACMLLFVYLRTSNLITGIKDGETQRKARRLALLGGCKIPLRTSSSSMHLRLKQLLTRSQKSVCTDRLYYLAHRCLRLHWVATYQKKGWTLLGFPIRVSRMASVPCS